VQGVELRVGEAASVVLVHICGIKGKLIEADQLAFEQPGVRRAKVRIAQPIPGIHIAV